MSVPTNRNCIGGIAIGMSNHIITKSKVIVDGYVDAAAIGRRQFILPGEVFLFIKTKKKSAEVIVVADTTHATNGETWRSHKTAKD